MPDRGLEVEVEHLHPEIANVTIRSAVYVEYLHLVRMREGWKIVNASCSTIDRAESQRPDSRAYCCVPRSDRVRRWVPG